MFGEQETLMKLNVDIDRPIDDVWTLLAEDFTSIAAWYDPVVRSYELPSTPALEGASCAGRVCEFTDDPDGLKAVEEIVEYDAEGRRLSIDVRVVVGTATDVECAAYRLCIVWLMD